jgi:hemoglobin-like flavoprotein
MTPEQVSLVQNSFEKVRPIAETAAQLFYDRLFEIAPEVQPLFTGDIKEQGRKLMTMLATAVASLDKIDQILPAVQELGRRHGTYGVRDEHYGLVGEALLWTLERGLGNDFTPDVKDAWAVVYGTLAQTMQDAVHGQAARAAQ